jgi:hypothetical protein
MRGARPATIAAGKPHDLQQKWKMIKPKVCEFGGSGAGRESD